jgi:hypothetical protein
VTHINLQKRVHIYEEASNVAVRNLNTGNLPSLSVVVSQNLISMLNLEGVKLKHMELHCRFRSEDNLMYSS